MQYAKAFKYKKWANIRLLEAGERQLHLLPKNDAEFFVYILNHTTVVDNLFISRIVDTEEQYTSDTPDTPTLPQLRERMEQNDSSLIKLAESASAEELDRVISFQFVDGDFGQLSVNEIFIHLLTHGSNHRGMAAQVLSSNQLERPRDTLTKYLHEAEPARRNAAESALA